MVSKPIGETAGPYQFFMLALSVFVLLALAVEVFLPISDDTRTILRGVDIVACGVFLLDFVMSLIRAPNRIRYFCTWGWIDLLSSIPAVGFLRIGRLARVARILRVLRGVRSTRLLSTFILERRAQSAILSALFLSFLLVTFSSIAILQLERVPESNILTGEDAFWWSLHTFATLDYQGKAPATRGGLVVGMTLALSGMALLGIFAGYAASWFLEEGVEAGPEGAG